MYTVDPTVDTSEPGVEKSADLGSGTAYMYRN